MDRLARSRAACNAAGVVPVAVAESNAALADKCQKSPEKSEAKAAMVASMFFKKVMNFPLQANGQGKRLAESQSA